MIPRNQYEKDLEEHIMNIPINDLLLVSEGGYLYFNDKNLNVAEKATAVAFLDNKIWYGCENGAIFCGDGEKYEKKASRNRCILGLFPHKTEMYDFVEQNHRQVAVYLTKSDEFVELINIPEEIRGSISAKALDMEEPTNMKNTLFTFSRVRFEGEKPVVIPPCRKLLISSNYMYGIPQESGIFCLNLRNYKSKIAFSGKVRDYAICPNGWR